MGDPKGEKLNLVIHNFGRDGGHSSYPLKEGVNIIRAKNKGLGYIEYFTSNYKKAPKVHLSILSGKVNGVFVGGVSKNSDWKRMLENSPTEVVDIVGNRVHLVYPVEELKQFCPDKGGGAHCPVRQDYRHGAADHGPVQVQDAAQKPDVRPCDLERVHACGRYGSRVP